MRSIKILIISFCMLITGSSFAADPAPLAMLKNVASQMLHELDKHIGHLKQDNKLVYDLVDRILVPHFELTMMSRAVVGRDYWQNASSDSQQQFMKEFTRYVIRTYSSALQSYDGETIKFFPIRGGFSDRVQVDSNLLLKNGPPIQMQYRLVQQQNQWLIYDFSVDGVSIVKNYNSQFAGTLRKGGLVELVRQLQKNNARK
jgi:phospholipid transport system substrate-binding protein